MLLRELIFEETGKSFDPEEDEIIIQGRKDKLTVAEIIKKLKKANYKRNARSVIYRIDVLKKAGKLGYKNFPWNDEEKDLIRSMMNDSTVREITDALNAGPSKDHQRSLESVKQKIKYLQKEYGPESRGPEKIPYTDSELDTLRALRDQYPRAKFADIAAKFKEIAKDDKRSIEAIVGRLKRMFPAIKKRKLARFSKAERAYITGLIEKNPEIMLNDIAGLLHQKFPKRPIRRPSTISALIKRLGLKRTGRPVDQEKKREREIKQAREIKPTTRSFSQFYDQNLLKDTIITKLYNMWLSQPGTQDWSDQKHNKWIRRHIWPLFVILKKQEQLNRCSLTGRPLLPDFHLEHTDPKSRGGAGSISSLRLANAIPNLLKGNSNYPQFVKKCAVDLQLYKEGKFTEQRIPTTAGVNTRVTVPEYIQVCKDVVAWSENPERKKLQYPSPENELWNKIKGRLRDETYYNKCKEDLEKMNSNQPVRIPKPLRKNVDQPGLTPQQKQLETKKALDQYKQICQDVVKWYEQHRFSIIDPRVSGRNKGRPFWESHSQN